MQRILHNYVRNTEKQLECITAHVLEKHEVKTLYYYHHSFKKLLKMHYKCAPSHKFRGLTTIEVSGVKIGRMKDNH